MSNPHLEKFIQQQQGRSKTLIENKWAQAVVATRKQFPDLKENDDKFAEIVAKTTAKMLGIKESLTKKKTKLQEADLSGGIHDPDTDVVTFSDLASWTAAMASCGADIQTGTIFPDTASAYINNVCVGEWNGDSGYADCAALDNVDITDPTIDGNSLPDSPPLSQDADDDSTMSEGFTGLLEAEMNNALAIVNEAKVKNTREANIDAQIKAAEEKIANLKDHKRQLIAQKQTDAALTVSDQINSVERQLISIRKQKKQLAAQRRVSEGVSLSAKKILSESLIDDLKKVRDAYIENQQINNHTANAQMLANHFGDDDEKAEAQKHMDFLKKNGYQTQEGTDFQGRMSRKYFAPMQTALAGK